MESPVQDIIIGNVPGAFGAETQANTDKNINTERGVEIPQTHNNRCVQLLNQCLTNTAYL